MQYGSWECLWWGARANALAGTNVLSTPYLDTGTCRIPHSLRLVEQGSSVRFLWSLLGYSKNPVWLADTELVRASEGTVCAFINSQRKKEKKASTRCVNDLPKQLEGCVVIHGLIASQSSQAWEIERGGGVRYSEEYFDIRIQGIYVLPWAG